MGDYWKCSRMGTLLCVYIDNQCTYFKNRDNMAYIAIYRASKPMSVVVVVVVVIKSQKTIGKKAHRFEIACGIRLFRFQTPKYFHRTVIKNKRFETFGR